MSVCGSEGEERLSRERRQLKSHDGQMLNARSCRPREQDVAQKADSEMPSLAVDEKDRYARVQSSCRSQARMDDATRLW
ncbi:hypothetical protein E4U31_006190 [Claviceps sp. LM219 group G6]|nr:hypothetical protein E4U31_006190 [Claviceps sp. LM219 group G6]